MSRFNALVARFPKIVIGLTLLVTVGAVMLLPGIKMDSNPYPLNNSHPSMVAFRKLKADFTGTLETALIHLRHPDTVFNAGTLRRVSAITTALEELTLPTEQDGAALTAILPQLEGEARETLSRKPVPTILPKVGVAPDGSRMVLHPGDEGYESI